MLDKVNVVQVVRDHVATLKRESDKKGSVADVLLFFGVPLLVAVVMTVWFRIRLSRELVGILVTSFSIFAALLFNLLLLIYDVARKRRSITNGLRARFLKEIYANIAYSILIALCASVVLTIYFVLDREGLAELIVSGVVYFLSGNFLLTMLMVLKRVNVLLDSEFRDSGGG